MTIASDYMVIICAATGYFNFSMTGFFFFFFSLCKSLKNKKIKKYVRAGWPDSPGARIGPGSGWISLSSCRQSSSIGGGTDDGCWMNPTADSPWFKDDLGRVVGDGANMFFWTKVWLEGVIENQNFTRENEKSAFSVCQGCTTVRPCGTAVRVFL
ncbi:transmembrane protein, putative [Medicago truncatula]|uniref:Transmembrane protein, putative n=1 Tax=Medicago truncatula TaxID=3880 RepID=G7J1Z0_MEDTR|nr:transmembrane protein, putative [Medicago truncatula]